MDDVRPLYHRFAWAYDLLVNEPIDARVAAMVSLLAGRGVRPGDEVVDVGCGTGRYASELAGLGFRVLGFDSSAEMIDMARQRPATANLAFAVGDLVSFKPPREFRAILCRGVLNDLLTDRDHEQVARQLARLLAPGGVLLLDVRDWAGTVDRYGARRRTARTVDLADGGRLIFRSDTTLDQATRQMMIRETFELRRSGAEAAQAHTTAFRMRCWSAAELRERLAPWFADVEILPDYVVPPAWIDRLVLVATRRMCVMARSPIA